MPGYWTSTPLRVLVLCGLVASLQIAGCGEVAPQQAEKTGTAQNLIQCKEPRPQICTNEYVPVCATLRDGTMRTYATKCVACSDGRVVGYQAGTCN